MSKLDRDPQVAHLAKELGLGGQAGWLQPIQQYARSKVEDFLRNAPIHISSLEQLLLFLAERLNVKIEYVRSDSDLERMANEYRFSPAQRRKLCQELNDPGTDGLLTYNPDQRPGNRHYLAVVDARGEHAARAFFTAWHELTHLIVTPPQRAFQSVYRTVSVTRDKDPEESVVDAVAGQLAFYEPLVRPVLEEAEAKAATLDFAVVEDVRKAVAPEASLFATGIACVHLTQRPVLLLQVAEGYKEAERRRLRSGQGEFDFGSALPGPRPELRAAKVIYSPSARDAGLRIFKNMRIPERSVLRKAFQASTDTDVEALENQGWWETKHDGTQPALPLRVSAVRRGSYVYGIVARV